MGAAASPGAWQGPLPRIAALPVFASMGKNPSLPIICAAFRRRRLRIAKRVPAEAAQVTAQGGDDGHKKLFARRRDATAADTP
jgi:hypothetical protein